MVIANCQLTFFLQFSFSIFIYFWLVVVDGWSFKSGRRILVAGYWFPMASYGGAGHFSPTMEGYVIPKESKKEESNQRVKQNDDSSIIYLTNTMV